MAAGETEGGGEGLFATLLALLGRQPAAVDGEAPSPVALPELPPAAALLDSIELPEAAADSAATAEGRALLRTLATALAAVAEALDAGAPAAQALEHDLTEALDAVAAYVATVPPPPVIAPAVGEAIAPVAAAIPEADPSSPVPAAPAPDPELAFQEALAATLGAIVPASGGEATSAAAQPAPPTPAAPPPLQQLAALVETLGNRLKQQAPELAARLEALAKELAAGRLPADMRAALGLGGDGEAADPELTRIIEALAAPKPAVATKEPPPAPPFIAPALKLPELTAKAEAPPAPPAPAAEPLRLDPVDRPEPAQTAARETRPVEAEARPAAAPPSPGTAPAATTDAAPPAPQPLPAAAGARAIHAAYQAPVQQANLPQLAFEVVRQFEAGNSRFQIRLDPPELGRIDVRLDVDKSGTVNARMIVERPETLDLMQRDQRALQQALQQAGLDSSKTNLEFSLRQNPFAQPGGMGDGRGENSGFGGGDGFGNDQPAAEAAATTYRGTATAGGVNLFV